MLLVARTARAAAFFSKSFSGRTARKVYWALVIGVPEVADGMIDLPLAKQPGTGGEKMHVDEEEGLPSRTRYRVIERAGNSAAWVELQPLTGRTHQLRVHMAAIGHPIVGDGKYGGPDAFLTGAISRKLHLHARRLRIDHPDGGRIDVTAELPTHFARDPGQSRLRPRARRPAARRGQIWRDPEGQAQGRHPPPPRPGARSARASGAAAGGADAPEPRFAWQDREAMLAFIAETRFLHDLRASESEPRGLPRAGRRRRATDRCVSTSRARNRGAAPARRRAPLLSCLGPDAYVSPDWYGTRRPGADLELCRGRGRRPASAASDEEELAGLLDDLSAAHEARLAPKPAGPATR